MRRKTCPHCNAQPAMPDAGAPGRQDVPGVSVVGVVSEVGALPVVRVVSGDAAVSAVPASSALPALTAIPALAALPALAAAASLPVVSVSVLPVGSVVPAVPVAPLAQTVSVVSAAPVGAGGLGARWPGVRGPARLPAFLLSLGVALAAALLPNGQARADTPASVEYRDAGPVGPEPVTARHHGGLYRISGQGRVAYLFGTVHVGAPSFYPMAPEAERALAGADQVVVELDPGANAAFLEALDKHGRYAPGDEIGRHLAPETMARLRTALHAEGVSVASMAHLKPWLVANLLTSMQLERHGYRRADGVEHVMLAQARRRGTRVRTLESAELQLALFDSMSDAESERYLLDTLDGLADGSAGQRARRVIEAWRSGKAAERDAAWIDATTGGSETADFTRRRLLGQRNPDLATRIDTLMGRGGVLFIGVGYLHLLGERGLPQLLAQRGYLVERVY